MKRLLSRIMTDPLIKIAITMIVNDIVILYTRAFINVVNKKIDPKKTVVLKSNIK